MEFLFQADPVSGRVSAGAQFSVKFFGQIPPVQPAFQIVLQYTLARVSRQLVVLREKEA